MVIDALTHTLRAAAANQGQADRVGAGRVRIDGETVADWCLPVPFDDLLGGGLEQLARLGVVVGVGARRGGAGGKEGGAQQGRSQCNLHMQQAAGKEECQPVCILMALHLVAAAQRPVERAKAHRQPALCRMAPRLTWVRAIVVDCCC